jgi:rhamnosyltransferase
MVAAVVTYHPTVEQVANIEKLREFLPVIVVDNTVNNRGIAWGLNEAARIALGQGHEWMLTLDQDADTDSLREYISEIQSYTPDDDVAVLAPKQESGQHPNIAITNGSVIRLSLWLRIHGFDNEMFIDEVDHEYCMRAIMRGYKVVRLSTPLKHDAGEVNRIRTVRGHVATVGVHQPFRLYYIYRNYWRIRKYRDDFPEFIHERKRTLFLKFREYALYHPHKIRSLWAMTRGTIAGMMWREPSYPEMTRPTPGTS